ncbi:MAG: polysaccharide deacetylase family protein [Candidatus Margulisiibacteriota bacterium]
MSNVNNTYSKQSNSKDDFSCQKTYTVQLNDTLSKIAITKNWGKPIRFNQFIEIANKYNPDSGLADSFNPNNIKPGQIVHFLSPSDGEPPKYDGKNIYLPNIARLLAELSQINTGRKQNTPNISKKDIDSASINKPKTDNIASPPVADHHSGRRRPNIKEYKSGIVTAKIPDKRDDKPYVVTKGNTLLTIAKNKWNKAVGYKSFLAIVKIFNPSEFDPNNIEIGQKVHFISAANIVPGPYDGTNIYLPDTDSLSDVMASLNTSIFPAETAASKIPAIYIPSSPSGYIPRKLNVEDCFGQGTFNKGVLISGDNEIWVTIDDGPNENTPYMLAVLNALNVKAIFFLVGDQVRKNPRYAKMIADAGHKIGSHGYYHQYFSKLSKTEIETSILAAQKIIYDTTGVLPEMIRPPYMDISNDFLETAKNFNLVPVCWSIDPQDWSINPDDYNNNQETINDAMYKKVFSGKTIANGDIILMHDKRSSADLISPLLTVINQLNLLNNSNLHVANLTPPLSFLPFNLAMK